MSSLELCRLYLSIPKKWAFSMSSTSLPSPHRHQGRREAEGAVSSSFSVPLHAPHPAWLKTGCLYIALGLPPLECEDQRVLEKGDCVCLYSTSIFLTQQVLTMENHEIINIILTCFSLLLWVTHILDLSTMSSMFLMLFSVLYIIFFLLEWDLIFFFTYFLTDKYSSHLCLIVC